MFELQASLITDPANSLPAELWAKIFEILQPTPSTLERHFGMCRGVLAYQSWFWQLPLVCRAFQNTFNNRPECFDSVSINKKMLDEAESSVQAWLQTHRKVLKSLTAYAFKPLGFALWLSALSGPNPALEFVLLRPVSQEVVNSLGTFNALTTCCLKGGSGKGLILDLTLLQPLDTLTTLKLYAGRFTSVNAAGHLTSLKCGTFVQVTSSSNCTFCFSLLDLQVGRRCNIAFHTRGLCACAALQSVEVGSSSRICATDRSNFFDHQHQGLADHIPFTCNRVLSDCAD